jgi:hypothetical protein
MDAMATVVVHQQQNRVEKSSHYEGSASFREPDCGENIATPGIGATKGGGRHGHA